MSKTTYIYRPTMLELYTRSQNIPSGLSVRLSKAPSGGKGLPKKFRWVETLDGQFLGMVLANCLVKE